MPRILVVDDDQSSLLILGNMLSRLGFEVIPHGTALGALAAIVQRLPDLILLDLGLPDLDGLEVCKRLKGDPATVSIPIIVISADQQTDTMVQAFQAGVVDFVRKPYNFQELQARVNTHLELKSIKARLEKRVQREELTKQIARGFINLNHTEFDQGLGKALGVMAEFLGVDRAFLHLMEKPGHGVAVTHEWAVVGVRHPGKPRAFPPADFPWWLAQLGRNLILEIPQVAALGPEASLEKAYWDREGVLSILAVPLIERGLLLGFVGFDSVSQTKSWQKEETDLLSTIGQDLVNLVVRHRNERDIQDARDRFQQLVTSMDSVFFLFSWGMEKLLFASPGLSDQWGLDEATLQQNPSGLFDQIHREDRHRVVAAFGAFLAGEAPFVQEFRTSGSQWLSLQAFRVPDSSGRPYRISAISNDITLRRKAELEVLAFRASELETSARIQRTILIKDPQVDYPGLDIHSLTIPSQEVDGDFYSTFAIGPGVFDLLIADVMGKGLTGAFLGAALKSKFLQATGELLLEQGALPSNDVIVHRVHQDFSQELIDLNSFITLVYARVDVPRSRVEFVDCGHTPIIHYHAATGRCWLMKGKNLPIGFFAEEEHDRLTVPFSEGDLFFFYSDGIVEAGNADGEMFGEDRLLAVIEAAPEASAQTLVEQVRESVVDFTGNSSFSDDFTAIAIRFSGPGQTGRTVVRRQIARDVSELPSVRLWIEQALEARYRPQGLGAQEQSAFILALIEGLVNVIKYGAVQPDFTLELGLEDGTAYAQYTYQGKLFAWTQVKVPDVADLQETGYGSFVMQSLTDSLTYATDRRGGIMLTMVKQWA